MEGTSLYNFAANQMKVSALMRRGGGSAPALVERVALVEVEVGGEKRSTPRGFSPPSGPSLECRHFQASHKIVLITTRFDLYPPRLGSKPYPPPSSKFWGKKPFPSRPREHVWRQAIRNRTGEKCHSSLSFVMAVPTNHSIRRTFFAVFCPYFFPFYGPFLEPKIVIKTKISARFFLLFKGIVFVPYLRCEKVSRRYILGPC